MPISVDCVEFCTELPVTNLNTNASVYILPFTYYNVVVIVES
jgi:hypothetical protein